MLTKLRNRPLRRSNEKGNSEFKQNVIIVLLGAHTLRKEPANLDKPSENACLVSSGTTCGGAVVLIRRYKTRKIIH